MLRIIILLISIGILIYVLTKFYGMLRFNQCASCDGLGYWESTRGERNPCKTCAGTGKG